MVLALVGAAVVYQLFCDPIVGTADNSDYWRVMKQIGVAYPESGHAPLFKNLQRDFVIVPREDVAYLTSQVVLGRIAVQVDRLLAKEGLFDIRVMGLVNSAAYLAALAVFLAAFRRTRPWLRVASAIASLLIFTDVRLVAYFNSFYCESAQLIFLVATVGFALQAADESLAPPARAWRYGGFVISAVLFMFAKTQDLVFFLPLAVIALRLFPSQAPRWRIRGAIAAAFVALFIYGMKSDAYAVTNRVNIDVTLSEEILPHSKDPTADLQELGDGDRANVTFGRIALFYAHHPYRWWKVARRRLHEAFTRTPYGNFEPPLVAESQAFDGFSTWKTDHYPRSLWFWIVAILAYGAALVAKWRLGTAEDRTRSLASAMWVVGCILEFVAIVTFEANGTEKHFFIFNVLVDLVLVTSLVELDRVVELWRALPAAPPATA